MNDRPAVDRRDPYSTPYDSVRANYPRSATNGIFVAVLHRTVQDRGLVLIRQHARCIRKGEIHELILTEETEAAPGGEADKIAYLGFIEFACGGVIVSGDRLSINGGHVGELVGYDETHMPNHMNILVRGPGLVPGYARGIMPGDRFEFRSPYKDERLPTTASSGG